MVQLMLMQVAISDAKARLTDLVKRAEAGEPVVLTRHCQVVARIVPEARQVVKPWHDMTVAQRRVILDDISEQGARLTARFKIDWQKAQDDLYDDDGLPA